MHSLKKKVKNKIRVEDFIVEAYIIEEISNFSQHYFNPSVQTKLTQVGRNDDGGAERSEWEISIFTYPIREFRREVRWTFSDTELRQAEIYVLLNCTEVDPCLVSVHHNPNSLITYFSILILCMFRQYDEMLKGENPSISDKEISTQHSENFAC